MKNKFSWKAFISLGLTYIIIILLVTGIVLYQSPSGRIAHWVNWKMLGLSKEQWQAVHTVFSFLFIILSVFHLLFMNWKSFWSYLKKKTKTGLNKKREFYLSTALTLIIFLGVIYSIPPVSYVFKLGEDLTLAWEEKESVPPVPHAEELTVNELAEQSAGLTVEKITDILKANSIVFENTEQTLAEIGEKNNMSPDQVYNIIYSEQQNAGIGGGGGGYGRMTLDQAAVDLGKDIDSVLIFLLENDIEITRSQNLRDAALANDITPSELYELIKKQ